MKAFRYMYVQTRGRLPEDNLLKTFLSIFLHVEEGLYYEKFCVWVHDVSLLSTLEELFWDDCSWF